MKQLEKRISDLYAQRIQKNSDYKTADTTVKELSEAVREIEAFQRQEKEQNQLKKKKRNDLE